MSAHSGTRPLVLKLVTLFISLSLSLLIAEMLAAWLVPSTGVQTDIFGRRSASHAPMQGVSVHGRFYHDLLPGQTGRTKLLDDYDFAWQINSLGLRGPEPSAGSRKPFRILVLGDSQTFGFGVAEDQTFCAVLQKRLAEAIAQPVEVLNAGVAGYGTFESLWKFQRVAPLVHPDLVIAVYFGDNVLLEDEGSDLWRNLYRIREDEGMKSPRAAAPASPPPARAKLPFLTNHSHFYALLSRAYRRLQAAPSYLDEARVYRQQQSQSPQLKMVWERTREVLREIAQTGAAVSHAETLIVYLPSLVSLQLQDSSAVGELQASGLAVLPIVDVLQRESKNQYAALRYTHDAHYNSLAHALIAQELFRFLTDGPWLAKAKTPASAVR